MYRLPDFHLAVDFLRGTDFTAGPTVMYSAGVSCQTHRTNHGTLIIKAPKGTSIPVNGQHGAQFFTWANVPSGSNNYYNVQTYEGVAIGYPNEFELYTAQYWQGSQLPH